MADTSSKIIEVKCPMHEMRLREQQDIAKLVVTKGVTEDKIKFIGGLDISFRKEDPEESCGCLVVLDYATLNVVYTVYHSLRISEPYQSGMLAFREVPVFRELLRKMRQERPDLIVDVFMIDGFGTLHVRGAGSATHFGVVEDVATIGVAKKLVNIGDLMAQYAQQASDSLDASSSQKSAVLCISNGMECGVVRTSQKPIFVSVGHKIDLDTAIKVVLHTAKHRIPEPVRQADLLSREWLARSSPSKKEQLKE